MSSNNPTVATPWQGARVMVYFEAPTGGMAGTVQKVYESVDVETQEDGSVYCDIDFDGGHHESKWKWGIDCCRFLDDEEYDDDAEAEEEENQGKDGKDIKVEPNTNIEATNQGLDDEKEYTRPAFGYYSEWNKKRKAALSGKANNEPYKKLKVTNNADIGEDYSKKPSAAIDTDTMMVDSEDEEVVKNYSKKRSASVLESESEDEQEENGDDEPLPLKALGIVAARKAEEEENQVADRKMPALQLQSPPQQQPIESVTTTTSATKPQWWNFKAPAMKKTSAPSLQAAAVAAAASSPSLAFTTMRQPIESVTTTSATKPQWWNFKAPVMKKTSAPSLQAAAVAAASSPSLAFTTMRHATTAPLVSPPTSYAEATGKEPSPLSIGRHELSMIASRPETVTTPVKPTVNAATLVAGTITRHAEPVAVSASPAVASSVQAPVPCQGSPSQDEDSEVDGAHGASVGDESNDSDDSEYVFSSEEDIEDDDEDDGDDNDVEDNVEGDVLEEEVVAVAVEEATGRANVANGAGTNNDKEDEIEDDDDDDDGEDYVDDEEAASVSSAAELLVDGLSSDVEEGQGKAEVADADEVIAADVAKEEEQESVDAKADEHDADDITAEPEAEDKPEEAAAVAQPTTTVWKRFWGGLVWFVCGLAKLLTLASVVFTIWFFCCFVCVHYYKKHGPYVDEATARAQETFGAMEESTKSVGKLLWSHLQQWLK